MIEIKRDLRMGIMGREFGGNHARPQKAADIAALLSKLVGCKAYTFQPGRGSEDDSATKAAVDWMQKGLEILSDGKYWDTFIARTTSISRGDDVEHEEEDEELMEMDAGDE
jgi:hypothetical protein